MMITTMISAGIASLYVVINSIITNKIPESISSLVYNLKSPQSYIWTIWMWLTSATIYPELINKLNDSVKPIGFATLASLVFCGAMPLIKNEKNTLHNIFGVIAGILSQVCVAFIKPELLIVWIVMLILLVTSKHTLEKYGVFIAECLCAISTYVSLMLS